MVDLIKAVRIIWAFYFRNNFLKVLTPNAYCFNIVVGQCYWNH